MGWVQQGAGQQEGAAHHGTPPTLTPIWPVCCRACDVRSAAGSFLIAAPSAGGVRTWPYPATSIAPNSQLVHPPSLAPNPAKWPQLTHFMIICCLSYSLPRKLSFALVNRVSCGGSVVAAVAVLRVSLMPPICASGPDNKCPEAKGGVRDRAYVSMQHLWLAGI